MNKTADTGSTSPSLAATTEASGALPFSSVWSIVGKFLLAAVGVVLGAIAGGVIGLASGLIQFNFC
jgi:hypothetical protein